MEFIDGVKISDVDGIKALGLNLKDVSFKWGPVIEVSDFETLQKTAFRISRSILN